MYANFHCSVPVWILPPVFGVHPTMEQYVYLTDCMPLQYFIMQLKLTGDQDMSDFPSGREFQKDFQCEFGRKVTERTCTAIKKEGKKQCGKNL